MLFRRMVCRPVRIGPQTVAIAGKLRPNKDFRRENSGVFVDSGSKCALRQAAPPRFGSFWDCVLAGGCGIVGRLYPGIVGDLARRPVSGRHDRTTAPR